MNTLGGSLGTPSSSTPDHL